MRRNQAILIFVILLISLVLKFHNYTLYPQRGATSDEYTYSFLGVSLLTKHIPISWSYFGGYKQRQELTINGIYFPIVSPYFDHPPFNGLVIGAWSIVFGGNTFEKIQLTVIRIVPIILSTLSALLVYTIAKRKFGFLVSLWALLIYVTVPTFVVQSRVVLAENLLTPLFLMSLYLYEFTKKRMLVSVLLGILSGLSFWTKEVGLSVFATLCIFMIYDRIRVTLFVSFIFVFALFFIGYLGYGAYFGSEIFWNIIKTQASRDVGPQTLFYLLSTPIIINKIYYDGWYFLGFISLFVGLQFIKDFKIIVIPAFIYFIFLLFLLTQRGEMGWYLIPLFPFMAIVTGRLLIQSLQTGNWYILAMILFVGSSMIQHLYHDNFGASTGYFRFFSILMLAPLIIAILLKKEKAIQLFGNAIFYLFILGNIFLTFMYVHPA